MPASAQYLLEHLDTAGRERIADALRCIESLDGFGLYLLVTRANRQLVNLGYADRVELRSGRTLTIIEPGSVQRRELTETDAQYRRRLTDLANVPDVPRRNREGAA